MKFKLYCIVLQDSDLEMSNQLKTQRKNLRKTNKNKKRFENVRTWRMFIKFCIYLKYHPIKQIFKTSVELF